MITFSILIFQVTKEKGETRDSTETTASPSRVGIIIEKNDEKNICVRTGTDLMPTRELEGNARKKMADRKLIFVT